MGALFSIVTEEDTEAGENPVAQIHTIFELQSWDWNLDHQAVEAVHSPITSVASHLTGFWELMGLLITTYCNQVMLFICLDFTMLLAFESLCLISSFGPTGASRWFPLSVPGVVRWSWYRAAARAAAPLEKGRLGVGDKCFLHLQRCF